MQTVRFSGLSRFLAVAVAFGLCVLATTQFQSAHAQKFGDNAGMEAHLLRSLMRGSSFDLQQKQPNKPTTMTSSSQTGSTSSTCCNQPNTLTVQGQGSVDYNTTLAAVQLEVQYEGRNQTAEYVLGVVANSASAAISVLKSLHVQKLETSSVNLSPIYQYPPNGPAQIVGYEASLTISYVASISEAGQTIDDAVHAGATGVNSVQFQAEPAVVLAARLQALRNAVNDASAQASAVLGVMGLTLGTPVSVDVNYVAPPPPSPLSGVAQAQIPSAMMAAQTASIPIQGGPQTVTATVVIVYSIN